MHMAQMMNVPVLGIVENMAYFQCDQCGKRHYIFGQSHLEEIAERNGIGVTAQMPLDPELAAACDAGRIEMFEAPWLDELADALQKL
jgi:Mrp family chromosome partitioning ATPase